MKRWRSIRRKIAKNSNRKGIYSHSIWNNFRKPGIYLMVTVILFITKVGILYTYGGEFGGFDIDIGADEGIFDNWEEAEGNQETTEPEQKENGSSNGNASNNNSNNDSANGGISSNDIENDGNNNSHNSGSSNDNNSGNNNSNNNNSNAGAGLSKTENGDNTGDKEGWEKPQAAGSERRPKENRKEIKKENSVTAASPANKNAENKKTNINADNSANGTESKSNTTKNTSRVKDRKKADRSKAKITESPKKENTSEHLKLTGAGTVFTAVGMAKTSHGLGFYNRNDENREKNENINKNNNINDNENGTIRFVHEETVPVNEYPEIQVIRTTGEQDVTILSLNLNGDEIFWHQKGDTLIFDQPITAKENTVKVIAVIDGRRIVHMPIWEF